MQHSFSTNPAPNCENVSAFPLGISECRKGRSPSLTGRAQDSGWSCLRNTCSDNLAEPVSVMQIPESYTQRNGARSLRVRLCVRAHSVCAQLASDKVLAINYTTWSNGLEATSVHHQKHGTLHQSPAAVFNDVTFASQHHPGTNRVYQGARHLQSFTGSPSGADEFDYLRRKKPTLVPPSR